MQKTLCVHIAAFTHPGLIHPHNEDCIAVGRWLGQGAMEEPAQFTLQVGEPLLCLVADGLGGHAAGEVASRYAAQRLSAEAGTLGGDTAAIAACLQRLHTDMQTEMRTHPQQAGMATTVAGLLITPAGITAFNVGDSRIYRWRQHHLLPVSVDDTPEAIYFGMADTLFRSHIITQCLGGLDLHREPVPHLVTQALEQQELYLLCSDGLTDMLSRHQLETSLTEDLSETTYRLFGQAMAAGGSDNISIILVRVEVEDHS
ncbi:MAG: PP2C family serine/threonine-protein phosphatase [Candidatus Competibacteraceae bacterium]